MLDYILKMKSNNRIYLIYLSFFIVLTLTSCEELMLKEVPFIELDAQFSASQNLAQINDTILFTQQSTTVAKQFSWDFGDSTTSTEANPIHSYSEIGLYTVTLTSTKADGITADTISQQIRIIPKTTNVTNFKTFGDADGGEVGRSIQEIMGDGFIIASRKNVSTIQLLKLDMNQTPTDTVEISGLAVGQGQVFVNDVVRAIDGGFVVVGNYNYSPDGSDNDSFIVKVKPNPSNGNKLEEEWRQVISTPLNERAVAVSQLSGSFYVTSSVATTSSSFIQLDVFDNEGNFTDNESIGTSWSGEQIIQTRDGGSIIAANDADNPMLLRLDANFDQLWREVSTFDGRSWGVTETQDRGIVIVGSLIPSSEQPDSTNAFILKYNDSGTELLWSDTLVLYDDIFYDVIELTDGSIVVVGINENPISGQDILLCKYSSEGERQIVKLIGGPQDDGAYRIISSMDDRIYLIGFTESFGNGNGRKDIYFLELNANLE